MELMTTELPRRRLLFRLFALLQGALAFVAGLPAVRFLATPLTKGTPEADWVRIGTVDDIPAAGPVALRYRVRVQDGYAETWQSGLVFVFRDAGQMKALSAVCTHLGCNVDWSAGGQRYECPCHGGRYSADGAVVAGPPPRRLAAVALKLEGREIFICPPAPSAAGRLA